MYDAVTGNWILTLTGSTAPGTIVMDSSGDMLIYIVNAAAKWMAMWNSTLSHSKRFRQSVILCSANQRLLGVETSVRQF